MTAEPGVRDRHEPLRAPAQVVVLVLAGVVLTLCVVGFVAAVVTDAGTTAAGTALGVGAAVGAFLVRRLHAAVFPYEEATEARPHAPDALPLPSPLQPTGRRRLLAGGLIAGAGVAGAGLLTVTARVAGPVRPGSATGWAAGVRLVDQEGQALRVEDIPPGGLSTTWPEGSARPDVDSVVLVRLSTAPQQPTNPDWVVDGQLVAYSKLCTHMGCPVGLLQEGEGSLFCPCHQARFDARRGAIPQFGPPVRPLPQLPLGVDDEGFLIALDDFPGDVGPTTGRSTRGSA